MKHTLLALLLIVAAGCGRSETLAEPLKAFGCTESAPCELSYTTEQQTGNDIVVVIGHNNEIVTHPLDTLAEYGIKRRDVVEACPSDNVCNAWLDSTGIIVIKPAARDAQRFLIAG